MMSFTHTNANAEQWITARELSLYTGMDERKISLWSQPLSRGEQAKERQKVKNADPRVKYESIPRMPFVMMDEKRGKLYLLSDVSKWMKRHFGQGWGYGESMEDEKE